MASSFESYKAFAALVGDIANNIRDHFVLKNPTHYKLEDNQNWTLFFPEDVSVQSVVFEGEVRLVLRLGGEHRTNCELPHTEWDHWNEFVRVHTRGLTGAAQLRRLLGDLPFETFEV